MRPSIRGRAIALATLFTTVLAASGLAQQAAPATKVSTLLSWTVTFLSTRRGQLTITEQQAFARTRLEQLAVLAAETKRPAARRAS